MNVQLYTWGNEKKLSLLLNGLIEMNIIVSQKRMCRNYN